VLLVSYIGVNDPRTCAHYNKSCPLAPQAVQNVKWLQGYFDWTKSDPKVAGINGWHFENRTTTLTHLNSAAGLRVGVGDALLPASPHTGGYCPSKVGRII
jgi:hypothetical protein